MCLYDVACLSGNIVTKNKDLYNTIQILAKTDRLGIALSGLTSPHFCTERRYQYCHLLCFWSLRFSRGEWLVMLLLFMFMPWSLPS